MMMTRERAQNGVERAFCDPPQPRLLAPSIISHIHINLVLHPRAYSASFPVLSRNLLPTSDKRRISISTRIDGFYYFYVLYSALFRCFQARFAHHLQYGVTVPPYPTYIRLYARLDCIVMTRVVPR